MSEVLQANIFFFITSVAVIVFSILLCILMYQVIRIAMTMRRIVDRIEAGSEAVSKQVTAVGHKLKRSPLLSSIFGGMSGGCKDPHCKKHAHGHEDEFINNEDE